jgi:starvation-inducible outer membrane lipoprotein
MKKTKILILFVSALYLTGCSTVGFGIAIPFTPFTNIGVNLNRSGAVSGNISTNIGGAILSGTVQTP